MKVKVIVSLQVNREMWEQCFGTEGNVETYQDVQAYFENYCKQQLQRIGCEETGND